MSAAPELDLPKGKLDHRESGNPTPTDQRLVEVLISIGAIAFAYPQHVELDGPGGLTLGSNPLVEKRKDKYRVRGFAERGADEDLSLPRSGEMAPPGGGAALLAVAGAASPGAHPRLPGPSPSRFRAVAAGGSSPGGSDPEWERRRWRAALHSRQSSGGIRAAQADDQLTHAGGGASGGVGLMLSHHCLSISWKRC